MAAVVLDRERADRALAVHDALRSYLPELIALGANAPYHQGEDSGLATVRPKLNGAWPRGGVPPAFRSWRDFSEFVVWGRDGGAFADCSHHWWDLRLNTDHGTIEVRAADTQLRVADSAAIVALAIAGRVSGTAGFDAYTEIRMVLDPGTLALCAGLLLALLLPFADRRGIEP